MSVLIKGIKMPEHCGQCFAYDTTYRVCNLYFMGIPNRMTSLEHRPEWCELVELPPHGRLIDADALPWENQGLMLTDPEDEWGLAWDIEHAPTIIPAEEGE